jgi:hypothetical protein
MLPEAPANDPLAASVAGRAPGCVGGALQAGESRIEADPVHIDAPAAGRDSHVA